MIFNLSKQGVLIAPASYWEASAPRRGEVCNGCGPSGWKNKIVPETMWGLNIQAACQIHDWMYEFGQDEIDKDVADDLFLTNLIAIIENHGGWLTWLRSYRAMTYYRAVKDAGDESFWKNKKAP
jgi:hypothetical protein